MLSIGRFVLVAALATLFVPGMARAQSSGEIFGRINDTSGAVMPGGSVTLSRPSLITSQTTVSLESGAYRFPSIPIGLYSVTFQLFGFKRFVRVNVRVETGFNAEINTRLDVSTVEET